MRQLSPIYKYTEALMSNAGKEKQRWKKCNARTKCNALEKKTLNA
jgi:hypothetical protein